MQLGMVGLVERCSNMVKRSLKNGHSSVVDHRSAKAVTIRCNPRESSLEDMVSKLAEAARDLVDDSAAVVDQNSLPRSRPTWSPATF